MRKPMVYNPHPEHRVSPVNLFWSLTLIGSLIAVAIVLGVLASQGRL